jgi:hypothetical protein
MAWPKGRPRSAESKRKTAESMRKHYESDPSARQAHAAFKGRKHSEETKRKMSEAALARWAGVSDRTSPKKGKGSARTDYTCRGCGKVFSWWKSQPRVFCSRTCQMRGQTGELSANWKGGIRLFQGYVMRRVDRKYKFEHRIVMEETLGRPMEEHETVHHKDADRANNAPENLELRNGRHGKGATKHCPTCTCPA